MSDRKLITASKAYLALPVLVPTVVEGCTHWTRPEAVWADEPGPAAETGTAFHWVAEEHTVHGPLAAQAALATLDTPETADRHARVALLYHQWLKWYEGLQHTRPMYAELKLAWIPRSGMAWQPTGERRDYSKVPADYAYAGTADLVLDHGDGLIEVLDYKTGYNPVPPTAPQMLLLGAMVAAFFQTNTVTVTVVTVHEDGARTESVNLGMDELVRLTEAFRSLLESPPGEPRPGSYCHYCPANAGCSAVQGLAVNAASAQGLTLHHKVTPVITSNDHAAWLVTMLPTLQAYIAKVEAAVKTYADNQGGIDLGDGAIYSAKGEGSTFPSVATPQARKALQDMGLGAAINHSTSWKDITRVGGPAKAEEARKKLVELGAVRTVTRTVHRTRRKQLKAS